MPSRSVCSYLIFAKKQTLSVGLVYLPVQRVAWRGIFRS